MTRAEYLDVVRECEATLRSALTDVRAGDGDSLSRDELQRARPALVHLTKLIELLEERE